MNRTGAVFGVLGISAVLAWALATREDPAPGAPIAPSGFDVQPSDALLAPPGSAQPDDRLAPGDAERPNPFTVKGGESRAPETIHPNSATSRPVAGPEMKTEDSAAAAPTLDGDALKEAVLISDTDRQDLLRRWHALPKKSQRAIRDECHRRGIGRGKLECMQLVDIADGLDLEDGRPGAP